MEGDFGGLWKPLGPAGGARRTGLNWAHLPPNDEGAPPHCHSTHEPNDVCYYPRSNKISVRGLGLIARLEPLDYFDGEPGR
ncbi:MAG TPA: hypothetical protein VFI01_02695 [Gaiellaceae bacterium]|nr:hypothetical protein [Gaiellaceae bacterium]